MNYIITGIGSILLLLSITVSAQKFETDHKDEAIVYFVKF